MSKRDLKLSVSPERVGRRAFAPLVCLSLFLTGALCAPAQTATSTSPVSRPAGQAAPTPATTAPQKRFETTIAQPPAVSQGAPTAPPPRAPRAQMPAPGAPRGWGGQRIATTPSATRAPQRVVTVIHRLSGLKLLKRLVANRQNIVSVDDLPDDSDVHTNIVAGFVSEDGRTVMARLPQAEVEVEAVATDTAAAALFGQQFNASRLSDLTLVRSDGARFTAKFVGLDTSTGLSLLESSEQLLPAQPTPPAPSFYTGTPAAIAVGQHIRLYAPAPVAPAPRPSALAPTAPVAPSGVIYMSMGETEGQLTEIKCADSNKPFQVTARMNHVSPVWTGAVATNDAGALVGIVSESGQAGTRIVPVEVVRVAAERVLARRASVPQPWLGARGDAVSATTLEWFVSNGWDRKSAQQLFNRQSGVLLSGVIPGAPAALGGLRPGDVITGVGEREVRGVEDFGQLLKEAGVGSTVNFKVFRPSESAPLNLSVRLSATQDPVRETRAAEFRAIEDALRAGRVKASAARAKMLATRSKLHEAAAAARAARMDARRIKALPATQDYARSLIELERRIREADLREAESKAALAEAEKRLNDVQAQVFEVEQRMMRLQWRSATGVSVAQPAPAARGGRLSMTLLGYGLDTIGLTQRNASTQNMANGLVVVSVRAESLAAASGIRPGDVIEMINGRIVTAASRSSELPLAGTADIRLGVVREGKRLTITLPRTGNAGNGGASQQ